MDQELRRLRGRAVAVQQWQAEVAHGPGLPEVGDAREEVDDIVRDV